MISSKLKGKKGVSLPLAMAIISVLIILSASLIAIAATSIMSTSSSVSTRQAYLNVRSAIEYAYGYYRNATNVPNLAEVDGQYMVMDDGWFMNSASGGVTAKKGAIITTDEAKAVKANTYVAVNYLPADVTGEAAMLKLTAYSRSTDAFGNRGETVHMSVAYAINSGANKNRITIPDIDMDTVVKSHYVPPDSVQLHFKQYPGNEWTPFYYLWTFKDVSNVYTGKDTCYDVESEFKYQDPNTPGFNSTTAQAKVDQSIANLNTNEKTANLKEPVSPWNVTGNNSDPENGPASFFERGTNGWFDSTYYYDPSYVNYFNLIITKKGKVLSGAQMQGNVALDVEANEMFHLWFLSNDDRHIYFEVLRADRPESGDYLLRYEEGAQWNGLDQLDDRFLVYVMNQKTTVHFRVEGVDDDAVETNTPNPIVTNVLVHNASIYDKSNEYLMQGLKFARFGSAADDNLTEWGSETPYYYSEESPDKTKFPNSSTNDFQKMMYEGSGWWVVNIPVAVDFTMVVQYYDNAGNVISKGPVRVDPDRDTREAFVVATVDGGEYSLSSLRTELRACDKLANSIYKKELAKYNIEKLNNPSAVEPDRITGSDLLNKYSTVKFKSANIGNTIAPRLDYRDNYSSLEIRRKLYDLITQVSTEYTAGDYDADAYKQFSDAVDEGRALYNNANYYQDELAKGRSKSEIEDDYQAKIDAINEAIANLKAHKNIVDSGTVTALQQYITEGKAIEAAQGKDGEYPYDSGEFAKFVSPTFSTEPRSGYYKHCLNYDGKILQQNFSASEIYDLYSGLKEAVEDIKKAKLTEEREQFGLLLNLAARYDGNAHYAEPERDALKTLLKGADLGSEPYDYLMDENHQVDVDIMALVSGMTQEEARRTTGDDKVSETMIPLLPVTKTRFNGIQRLLKDQTTKEVLEAATDILSRTITAVEGANNYSSPELKAAYKALYDSIQAAEKFRSEGINSTAALLKELNKALLGENEDGEGGAKAVYNKSDATVEELTTAKTLLDEALKKAIILYPDSKLGEASKSKSELDAAKKMRIWFMGFNDSTEIKKYIEENKNVTPNTTTDKTCDYKLGDFYVNEYRKSVDLEKSVSSHQMKSVGTDFMYYDFEAGSCDALSFMLTVVEYNRGTKTNEYLFTCDPVSLDVEGCVIRLNNLRQIRDGHTGVGNQEIVKYTLDAERGKLAQYYVDIPTGRTDTKLNVDGKEVAGLTEKATVGTVDAEYRVFRFFAEADQSGVIRFKDGTAEGYAETEEFELDAERNVVKVSEETPDYVGKKVTATFTYPSRTISYQRVNKYGYGWNSTYNTVTEEKTFTKPTELKAVATYTDGTTEDITCQNTAGSNYTIKFTYQPDVTIQLCPTYSFDYETYVKNGNSWEKTNETKTTGSEEWTNAATVLENAKEYEIRFGAGSTVQISVVKKDTTSNKTYVAEVYPADTINRVKNTSGSSAASLPTIVSDTLLSGLLKAPAAVNDDPADMITIEVPFDYFGQSGKAVTPTKHMGETVIWVDASIKIGSSDNKTLEEGGLKIYVFGEGSMQRVPLLDSNGNQQTNEDGELLWEQEEEKDSSGRVVRDYKQEYVSLESMATPDNKVYESDDYKGHYIIVKSKLKDAFQSTGYTADNTTYTFWIQNDNIYYAQEGSRGYYTESDSHGRNGLATYIHGTPRMVDKTTYQEEAILGTEDAPVSLIRVEESSYYYVNVPSRCRGCILYRSDKGTPEKIGPNTTGDYRYWFDAHQVWQVSGTCSTCGTSNKLRPSSDHIVGQGLTDPFVIFNQYTYAGYNTKNGKTRTTDGYYNLSHDKYHSEAWSRMGTSTDVTYTSSNSGHTGIYKFRPEITVQPPTYKVKVNKNGTDRSTMVIDKRMVFVGGSKLRMVNESYYDTYSAQNSRLKASGAGKTSWPRYLEGLKNERNNVYIGKPDSFSSLFGGADGNGSSQGRIGDTRLYIIYDWYEFKIPVDKEESSYNVQFAGLQKTTQGTTGKTWIDPEAFSDKYRFTEQLQNVYGDIYVVMKDNEIGSGDNNKYQHYNVYTQDPEIYQIEDDQKIYVKTPSTGNWRNVVVKAYGKGTPVELSSTTEDGMRCYKVPSGKPFLQITADYDITNSAGTVTPASFFAKTALQGNDKICYNTALTTNGNMGGWETFVPTNKKIERNLYAIHSIYYGKVIPAEIGSDFKVVKKSSNTYKFPKAIKKVWLTNSYFNDGTNVKPGASPDLSMLERWVGAYTKLYELMSKAKNYLGTRNDDDSAGPYYPNGKGTSPAIYYQEFEQNGTPEIYDPRSIKSLYNELVKAEDIYLADVNAVSYVDNVEEECELLERAINDVQISTDNTIPIIFYDARGLVAKGYNISIKYQTIKNNESSTVTDKLRYKNSDGLPIIFVPHEQIYNVRILLNGVEQEKLEYASVIDGAWVYMDIRTKPYWQKNTVADYYQINSSVISSSDAEPMHKFEMNLQKKTYDDIVHFEATLDDAKKLTYKPATLYFKTNTTVKYPIPSDDPIKVRVFGTVPDTDESGSHNINEYSVWVWFDNKTGEAYNLHSDSSDNKSGYTDYFELPAGAKTMYILYRRGNWAWQTAAKCQLDLTDSKFVKGAKVSVNTTYKSHDDVMSQTRFESPQGEYVIRAGAYSFSKAAKNNVAEPKALVDPDDPETIIGYTDDNTSEYNLTPFVYTPVTEADGNVRWHIKCDLFSERAKAYFTDPSNYGKLSSTSATYVAVDAEDLPDASSWVTKDGDKLTITAGSHYGVDKNINLTFNDGSFYSGPTWDYITAGDLYFRWDGSEPLKVNNTVTLMANKVIFASSNTIDVTQNYNKHFYFNKQGASQMSITFTTDVTVKYYDTFRELHTFIIREGEYVVNKATDNQQFIADLCDKEYWTSLEHVEVVNRYGQSGEYNGTNSGGGSSTGGRLSNPLFG